MNHDWADFEFIGPDKAPIRISTVEECIHVADTIRATGGARIPLVSDLNYQAWANHLKDYPDKILIQYLRFGLPLSLSRPDQLNNIKLHNYPSAAQYPQAVEDYIDKEISLAAMLGPVPEVHSRHPNSS